MTANVSRPYAGATPTKQAGLRWVTGILGLAMFVLGVVLLFRPVAAAHLLALLFGLAFIIGGLLELAVGWDSPHRWVAFLLGAILVIGGVLAIVWPRMTLGVLVLIVGLSLIVHGIGRIGLALAARDVIHNWGWLAVAGLLNVLVGACAVAWPSATVLVLSLLLGVQIALFGLLLLGAAFVRPGAHAA